MKSEQQGRKIPYILENIRDLYTSHHYYFEIVMIRSIKKKLFCIYKIHRIQKFRNLRYKMDGQICIIQNFVILSIWLQKESKAFIIFSLFILKINLIFLYFHIYVHIIYILYLEVCYCINLSNVFLLQIFLCSCKKVYKCIDVHLFSCILLLSLKV